MSDALSTRRLPGIRARSIGWTVALAGLFLALLILARSVPGAEERIRIAIEVEILSDPGAYTQRVQGILEETINGLLRYDIVAKKEAKYLVKAQLFEASELVVENVPTADIGFSLRVYEMIPGTGKHGFAPLVNSVVTKQLVGSSLDKAIGEVVRETTTTSLETFMYRFNFPPAKKSTLDGGRRSGSDIRNRPYTFEI